MSSGGERVGVQVTALTMAEPEIIVRSMVSRKAAFGGVNALGSIDEMSGIRRLGVGHGEHVLGQRNLVDTGPVATIDQVRNVCNQDSGVDGIRHVHGILLRSNTGSCLQNQSMIGPSTWAGMARGRHTDSTVTAACLADGVVAVEGVSDLDRVGSPRFGVSTFIDGCWPI